MQSRANDDARFAENECTEPHVVAGARRTRRMNACERACDAHGERQLSRVVDVGGEQATTGKRRLWGVSRVASLSSSTGRGCGCNEQRQWWGGLHSRVSSSSPGDLLRRTRTNTWVCAWATWSVSWSSSARPSWVGLRVRARGVSSFPRTAYLERGQEDRRTRGRGLASICVSNRYLNELECERGGEKNPRAWAGTAAAPSGTWSDAAWEQEDALAASWWDAATARPTAASWARESTGIPAQTPT